MLPITPHSSDLLKKYPTKKANINAPIIYLYDETNSFLNLTISYILNKNKVHYIPRVINHMHQHHHGNHSSHTHSKRKSNANNL